MIGKKDIEGFGNDLTDRVPYITVLINSLPAGRRKVRPWNAECIKKFGRTIRNLHQLGQKASRPVQRTHRELPAWIVRAHIAFLKKHSTGGIPYSVRQESLPDTTRSKRRSVRAA